MSKNLLIVESPAKAKTIEKILGKDFTVKSSFGHVRDLAKKNMGIDLDNEYEPQYEVSADKKKVVAELKKLAKNAEVWLATDEDREGEAISWHLLEVLGLKAEDTKRIVFHEITPKAILSAVQNPRTVDLNLVNAQQARRVLDRLVGFKLSPVLWKKISRGNSLSAGRVQSVAVKILVERERQIINFSPENYFKVTGLFDVKKADLKAECTTKFKTLDKANDFLQACANNNFSIGDVSVKPGKRSPSAPFTTSTLQQEASRKLGFSVSRTMGVAQRLYENGLITYMRTDSVNLSQTALDASKKMIESEFGSNYSFSRKYKNKNSGAQEAHEAIRPTYFEKQKVDGARDEQRLYDLIWKRTVASQMADAKLERTTIKIDLSNRKELFSAKGEVIKFDGFLKLYIESTDDDDGQENQVEGLLPPVKVGDNLIYKKITATQRFTNPLYRYTEASLVKKMEELGIGRPSTYAPTINTIQKRGYANKETRDGKERKIDQLVLKSGQINQSILTETYENEKNKLFPTDLGMVVTDFLDEHFPKIMDFSFTAEMEQDFDQIAEGKQEWNEIVDEFYQPFLKNIEDTTENAERASGERILGEDPKTGRTVLVRIGGYGPVAQIGTTDEEEAIKYASLKPEQHLEQITLEEALVLFKLPKDLGEHEGHVVTVSSGRYGPYIKYNEMFVSIPKSEEPLDVELSRAIELIKEKQEADAPVHHYEDLPVQKGKGRFGPFIKWNDMFINVNKKYDFDNLSIADIEELIEVKKQKEIDKVIHNWEEEGIRVEKARWGRFKVIQGKTFVELPKTTEVEKITLSQASEMIENAKPKKKKRATKKK